LSWESRTSLTMTFSNPKEPRTASTSRDSSSLSDAPISRDSAESDLLPSGNHCSTDFRGSPGLQEKREMALIRTFESLH
jgi:hypothetical protein